MPHYFSYVYDGDEDDFITGFADKVVLRHPDDTTWVKLGDVFLTYLRACNFVIPNHVRFALVDEETGEEYNPKHYYDL